jgi:polar amino acid transport system substrate-binding protein
VKSLSLVFLLLAVSFAAKPGASQEPRSSGARGQTLRVGVAGSQPFIVRTAAGLQGIAFEIWESVAAQAGWRYSTQQFENVPEALDALVAGKLDVVVGPVSITAERAKFARFSQPYFASSLSILSRTEPPTLWQRIAPFFSRSFFIAVAVLLSVLALVGTLVWLAERRAPGAQFANEPVRGIANGIWLAIVTMSTVGYGDLTPKTFLGRLVTGIWIVISVITATSLVAGIASTLTLTGMQMNTISTAEELRGRSVAVLADSPGQTFAVRYGARPRGIESLREGYALLKQGAVDALVFDRPQLQYFLSQQHDTSFAVSNAEYMRQNYGFALPLSSTMVHELNVNLLQLEESGRVARTVRAWLGEEEEE